MPHRYSTALSHLLLAGSGIYCWQQIATTNMFNYSQGCYGIIILNSVLGVWRWGNPVHGDKVVRLYKLTKFLETIFALPFITTSLWMNYKHMWEVSITHIVLSLIVLGYELPGQHSRGKISSHQDLLVDAVISANIISLGAISLLQENYFGIATALSMALNHFVFTRQTEFDIPPQDLYNYGMCFFALFALKALNE